MTDRQLIEFGAQELAARQGFAAMRRHAAAGSRIPL